MSGEKKVKKRRRRVAQDERGFYGFVIIVISGTVAVLLSTIV